MADDAEYRELLETEEYSAQLESLAQIYSDEVLRRRYRAFSGASQQTRSATIRSHRTFAWREVLPSTVIIHASKFSFEYRMQTMPCLCGSKKLETRRKCWNPDHGGLSVLGEGWKRRKRRGNGADDISSNRQPLSHLPTGNCPNPNLDSRTAPDASTIAVAAKPGCSGVPNLRSINCTCVVPSASFCAFQKGN